MKKFLAVLLTAAMLLTGVPGAYAGDLGQEEGQEIQETQQPADETPTEDPAAETEEPAAPAEETPEAEEPQPGEDVPPEDQPPAPAEVSSEVGTTSDGGAEIPAAAEASLETVYVSENGSDETGDGTAENPVATLAEAYKRLAEEGGTIMVCGTVTMAAAADVSGTKAASGTVTIRGDETTGGTLKYTAKGTNQIFGKATVIEHLAIEMPTAKKSPVTFYSNESLTIGENVTVSTPANFQIYGGSPSADPDLANADIKIAVNSGEIQAIWACGKQAVKSVTIDLGGTANVLSHVRCGGQSAAESVTLNVEVEGKTYSAGNAIYLGAKTDPSAVVDAININLKTGILKKKGICVDTEVSGTAKNIHVTIHPDFEFSLSDTGKYGYKLTGTEANTLTLPGWNGTPPDGMLASYDTITLTENSTITCEDVTELANKTITVESGSTLTLPCTEAEAEEAGVTITGNGKVTYTGQGGGEVEEPAPHNLDVVYVNGTLVASGDGKTADTAVRTLAEAYDLLKETGGAIVVCGDLIITKADATIPVSKTAAVTGEVTITSLYGTEDYTDSAAVTIDNTVKSIKLMFGPRTTLEHITFKEPGSNNFNLYSNLSLTTGEGFICDTSETKRYIIFAGQPGADLSDQDITITLNSGTFNGVMLGPDAGDTGGSVGKVTYVQGGTTNIISNLTLGGQESSAENPNAIDATINGGYAKVIYDTPRNGGHVSDVTLRLNGGSITEFRDYTNLKGTTMGNITVYLSPDFACSGSIGVWTSGDLTAGRKALVMTGYAGINPPKGAENYDVVNLVGGGTVPTGLDVSPAVEDSTKLLQIADYQGDLSIGLDGFDKLNVSHSSDIRYLGTFPQGVALDVEEGSVLRLSAASNSEVPKYTGDGKVELVMPEYSDPDMVLSVNFDDRDAQDLSGKGNDGAVYGSPAYVESYDGSKALYLSNEYGEAAWNYVLFEDLEGVDLTRDNYTVSFWMRTENGGADQWHGSGEAVNPGSGLAMNNKNEIGGVLFANTDASSGTAPGFAAAQLHGKQYLTLAMTDSDGGQKATDGSRQTADGLWYMVTVTVDRNGSYQLYINDTLISAVSIAGMEGQALGRNVLSLGADALGQYGIGCAYFDDLAVYSRALSAVDVQANYCLGALKLVLHEMEARLAGAGEEYTDEARDELRAALKEGLREAAGLTAEDYLEAQTLEAELRTALEDFLMSPEANLTLLLISDIHVKTAKDTRANKLRRLFADREESDIYMDGILQSGDFADNSIPGTSTIAFDVMEECFEGHEEWQMIGCTGNHETQFTKDGNYMASSEIYWQRMQAFVSGDDSQKYGGGVLDSVWQQKLTGTDGKTYTGAPSFGLTFKDYHFVVLNSDNPGQYSDLSALYKENPGISEKEALAADPIRHGAWFSEETQAWLDGQMAAYAKDGKPIFVVCHFPFIDTVPLSYFDPIPINDNSIGRQDKEIRNILAKYDNVLYFCGHLHSNMGVNNVVTVEAANGGSFTEINLPTLNSSARGYADMPATWYMYVYDTEIVLRGRDALNSRWLTGYDIVIPLGGVELNRTELTLDIGETKALTATITATGAESKTVTWSSSNESVAAVDENGVVTAVGRGEAIITVTAGSYSASCTVEVQRRPYIPVPPTKPTEPDEPDTPDEPDEPDTPDTPDVPDAGYADVQENAWYAEAVDYVTAQGLMTGTAADAFAPELTTTRAMVWTILGRMSGAGVSGGEPWYGLAQRWAVETGVSDGSNPDGKITREQLAAMLYRFAGEPELLDSELAGLSGYADHNDVSSYAYRAMAWAVSRGIINGVDGALVPQGLATRAQVAAMLMRYCELDQ